MLSEGKISNMNRAKREPLLVLIPGIKPIVPRGIRAQIPVQVSQGIPVQVSEVYLGQNWLMEGRIVR